MSIVNAIHQLLPDERLIYVADNQHAPYGEKSDDFIASRVLAIAKFLIQQDVKAIVVACNTATAAAVQSLRDKYHIPIIGVEPALKPAAEYSLNKKVGVIATKFTLASQKYKTLRSRFEGQVEIVEKASPLFVTLVETIAEIGEQEIALIKQELQPFVDAKVDSLVLGCTHYPFLQNTLAEILGKNIKLFESGLPVAIELRRRLENKLVLDLNSLYKANHLIDYYSSEPTKAQSKFEIILGHKVDIKKLPD